MRVLIEKIKKLWYRWIQPQEPVDNSPFPELRISKEILDELKETREEKKKRILENIIYLIIMIVLIVLGVKYC
jgi:hypothetical protein